MGGRAAEEEMPTHTLCGTMAVTRRMAKPH